MRSRAIWAESSGPASRRRSGRPVPRPVTIVDAGWRRDLDLQVIWPRKLDRRRRRRLDLAGDRRASCWRSCGEHRSTIIFANNRRTVEKLTARLNELADGRRS